MKPGWQQQQQQMQKQQQQMRHRQMEGAYWQQQQKAKAEQARVAAQRATGDPFARVEAEAAKLRLKLAGGQLSEDQFKAELQKLMVQDTGGRWWMIGIDTGQWHVHDGKNWVPADPPGHGARKLAASALPQGSALPKAEPNRLKGCSTLVGGLILTVAASLFVGAGSWQLSGAVLLIGLVATLYFARQAWRDE